MSTKQASPSDQGGQVSVHVSADGDFSTAQGLTGIVISGAGARGAYEAGVLATLLPGLFPGGLGDALLLGTSAGSVNASLWGQLARPGRPLAQVGEEVCKVWEGLAVDRIYRPIAWTFLTRLASLRWIGNLTSIFDTTPNMENARALFKIGAIAANIEAGSVGGVGVVATTCPPDATGGRSRIFWQSRRIPAPTAEPGGAIDYVDAELTHEHVLASSAIPVLFPAVHVSTPSGSEGYYTDGGLRLNTPIRPAIDLGARRLVVISSSAMTYPLPRVIIDEEPDVIDLLSQSMQVALADGMIEDLRTLRRINALVAQARASGVELMNNGVSPARPYRDVPLVTVSPRPGSLAELAREVLTKSPASSMAQRIRRLEYKLLRGQLAGFGDGPGNDETLSYLFFDPEFAREQVARGKNDGEAALALLKGRKSVRRALEPKDGPS